MYTLGKLSICAFLVATLQYAHAQSTSNLCAGCTMVNGAGYKSHPADCDKYIQCHLDALGSLVGEIRQCAFSTYWDMSLLTCLPVSEATCPYDKCAARPDDTIYGASGNCRGYWQCKAGVSRPMCCPVGQKFVSFQGCVDNVNQECTDTCFNDDPVIKAVAVCDDMRDAPIGLPGIFEQYVAGWGWVRMQCAPGTTFVKELCGCDKITPVQVQHSICRAEVYLPFTSDYRDESGNGYYVMQENVQIQNGIAKFNGQNSRLIIPRFTNLEHSTTVVIKAKYISNHMSSPREHAIVSNNDCGNMPSILISENATDISFGVGTSDALFATAHVQQENIAPFSTTVKDIVYTFDNGVLKGSNGHNADYTLAKGYLRNVQCALHIGHAENLAPFLGEIDEVTVYLCNPDKP